MNLVRFYNSSREGKGVEVLTSEEERRIMLPQYLVLRTSSRRISIEFVTSEGIVTSQRKLPLPLSEDGQRVNMVLGESSPVDSYVGRISAPNRRLRRIA